MRRFLSVPLTVLALSSCAFGYYHFNHFLTSTSPFTPVPERFDTSRLPNGTLQYFIADDGPDTFAAGDNFPALISQIRLAAKTWNDVATSDLRIAFGGLVAVGTTQNGPAVDVSFDDDIPPGLIAYGGPTALGPDFVKASSGTFAPVAHSVLRLRRDLTNYPSYGEDLFLTIVHEMGHALGLQHTFTSSVMSTSITRGTTKAQPLGADDIAGISVLYPSAAFARSTATISGRVTMNGSGVNLASVVAISPTGLPVSALTNPDGAYTIRGIPPGQSYYVYAHPLPPALPAEVTPGNVVPPKDPNGQSIPASGAFDTQFFPGTRDLSQAAIISLNAGDARVGVDFAVQPRSAPDISSVTSYGYVGTNAVHPGPLILGSKGATMVATGTGLLSGSDTVTPGLNVSTLGAASVIPDSVRYYTGAYIMFGLAPVDTDTPGPRHLVFSTPNDMYILPAAFQIVRQNPPSITTVTASVADDGTPAVIVSGTNLAASTRVYFDGSAGTTIRQNEDGSLLVSVPPAAPGYTASVTAYNTDGLSSLFVQPQPATFSYPSTFAQPSVSINPAGLMAGTEAMIEVTGLNFANGQVSIGFGSSDVVVRRLWVRDRGTVWANVRVGVNATAGAMPVTVTSGLETVRTTAQIAPASSSQASMQAKPVNTLTGGSALWSGVVAMIPISNLQASVSRLKLTVGGQAAQILSTSTSALTFQVPTGLTTGPAIVQLAVGGSTDQVPPIVVQIDPAPPVILGVSGDLKVGSAVTLSVTGLGDPAAISDASMVRVSFGGIVQQATAVNGSSGKAQVAVTIPSGTAVGQVPVTLTYNGMTSPAYYVSISQ